MIRLVNAAEILVVLVSLHISICSLSQIDGLLAAFDSKHKRPSHIRRGEDDVLWLGESLE